MLACQWMRGGGEGHGLGRSMFGGEWCCLLCDAELGSRGVGVGTMYHHLRQPQPLSLSSLIKSLSSPFFNA